MSEVRQRALDAWRELYGDDQLSSCEETLDALHASFAASSVTSRSPKTPSALDEAVIYALYVDRFATNFAGLKKRLPYLQDLGVSLLWLLPILDSPMADQGFDVRDYHAIRPDLLGDRGEGAFDDFMAACGRAGMEILFDLPLNHASKEHPFFQAALRDAASPYRSWFLFADDDQGFSDARKLFAGMVESNWEPVSPQGPFYFHRFYPFQPDWNYETPDVLLYFLDVMVRWRARGVRGFRLDAIPFLAKAPGTPCEDLPRTHTILRFLRAALDAIAPGTLLVAEACQPPARVVSYFGRGDECHAAYHFPLMPMIFLALHRGDISPVTEIIAPTSTPAIPDGCHWLTFLRCHDELTLEMVDADTRQALLDAYLADPRWSFREAEGISARLADLLGHDSRRILLAFVLLVALGGVPVIYYGDELASGNCETCYETWRAKTGYVDSRFFLRPSLDWPKIAAALDDPTTLTARVHDGVAALMKLRHQEGALRAGELLIEGEGSLARIERRLPKTRLIVLLNLSPEAQSLPQEAALAGPEGRTLLSSEGVESAVGVESAGKLPPYGWIVLAVDEASSYKL